MKNPAMVVPGAFQALMALSESTQKGGVPPATLGLVQELVALYEAFIAGKSSPLAELPVQYADFAWWQRRSSEGEALQQQLSYWKRQLAGAPTVLRLPTDRPRPAVQQHEGSHHRFELEEPLVGGMVILCATRGG